MSLFYCASELGLRGFKRYRSYIILLLLDVDIPGKRRRGRPNLRWKDVCKRDMTQAGLKEDNTTNRAEWRKKVISYTGDPK